MLNISSFQSHNEILMHTRDILKITHYHSGIFFFLVFDYYFPVTVDSKMKHNCWLWIYSIPVGTSAFWRQCPWVPLYLGTAAVSWEGHRSSWKFLLQTDSSVFLLLNQPSWTLGLSLLWGGYTITQCETVKSYVGVKCYCTYSRDFPPSFLRPNICQSHLLSFHVLPFPQHIWVSIF